MSPMLTILQAVLNEFAPSSLAIPCPDERTPRLEGLTLVVDDLATASATLAAHFGHAGHAVEPEELEEAGLAQRFDLETCRLLVLEPGSDTDAEDFLLAHGPGLYAVAVGSAPEPSCPALSTPNRAAIAASAR